MIMTKDNEDALRCADWCDEHSSGVYRTSAEAAAHLRRLVQENEAKDALLRQAVEALENCQDTGGLTPHNGMWTSRKALALIAIRQHLEGRA